MAKGTEIFRLFGSILINTDKADESIAKTEKKTESFGKKLSSGIATAAKWGAGIASAAGAAVVGLLKLDEVTAEYRENQAKLVTAWEAQGQSAETAKQAYDGLYQVLGDSGEATEAAQLLSMLATSTQDVATWTDIAAGVSGQFGDALPIAGLIEAANETAKVGTVTGSLADALNWAGISEDDFNAKLAECGSEQERNALITETLSKTYEGATEAFKANNAEVMAARDAQAQLDATTAQLGEAVSGVKNKLILEFLPSITSVISAFIEFTKGTKDADVALQESIKNMVDNMVKKLPEFLSFGIQIILAIAKGIVQNLPYLLSQIPGLLWQVIRAFASLDAEFRSVGREMINSLWDGLKSVWSSISSWVNSKVDWIADKLAFWRKSESQMDKSSVSGSHAAGLAYVPYDGYIAELHRGERVLTAEEAKEGTATGGGLTININGLSVREEADIDKIAQRLYALTKRNARGRGLVTV